MKELLRTVDPVLFSWLTALLADAGIEAVVLDTYTSILEGSIGAIPRRLMVVEEDYTAARRILVEAGHLPDPDPPFEPPEETPVESPWSEDRLLDGRIRLKQPRHGYRAAIDPVLLAAARRHCRASASLMSGPEWEPHPSASPSAFPACTLPAWNSSPIWRNLPPSISATTTWKTAYGILSRRPPVSARPPAPLQLRPRDVQPSFPEGRHAHPATGSEPGAGPWRRLRRPCRLDRLLHPDAEATRHFDADPPRRPSGRPDRVAPWPVRRRHADTPLAESRTSRQARPGHRPPGLPQPRPLSAGLVLHEADGGFTPAAEAILRHGNALEP